MRYTVASLTIEQARAALSLDAGKDADAIRAIVARRGMEAEAALDAAMVRRDFATPEEAHEFGSTVADAANIFEVSGLAFDGVNLVEAFGWEGH